MANRFVPPVSQLVNDDASGIAGKWQLDFFTTGTSTRKDTFSDNALTVANANPVVGDSSGRFGDIFLGSGDYKVVLKDDNDVSKWTADPVAGSVGATGAVDAKTAAYTITTGDATKTIAVDASSGALTITLPAAASATNGFEVTVKKTDSSTNAVTIDGNGTETIDGATTLLLSNQYDSATLRCDGSNWLVVADTPRQGTNIIINGDFRVAQRGTSFISTTVPANSDDNYLLDRWVLLSDGNDIVDVTQGTDGSVGNGTFLQADVETIAKKFGFLTVLENKDVQDILSESDVVSLSFNALVSDATKLSRIKAMVLSWTSTADSVTSDIVNAWGVEGTSPTVVANWTIEGDSGDLGVTNSDTVFRLENVAINASGVNNIAVFIWSDDVATNDTLGTLLKITNVQLESGAVATPYQARPFQQELALCQRYYAKTFNQGTAPAQNAGTSGAVSYRVHTAGVSNDGEHNRFAVVMRATPTITFYNPSAANALWRNISDSGDSGTATTGSEGEAGIFLNNAQASGDGVNEFISIHYSADAEL